MLHNPVKVSTMTDSSGGINPGSDQPSAKRGRKVVKECSVVVTLPISARLYTELNNLPKSLANNFH